MYRKDQSNQPLRVMESGEAYGGKQFINQIGDKLIREAVTSILCGGNIRTLTEGMTRKRLAQSNATLLVSFLRSHAATNDFTNHIAELAKQELISGKTTGERRSFLLWCLGLTNKGIQNILRGDKDGLDKYLQTITESINQSAEISANTFGKMGGTINFEGTDTHVDWLFLLYLFTAIGAQTLTIRGSEKSIYGKLFEKLVLGSLLTILGFSLVPRDDPSRKEKIFWLSERGEKRESDATLLYKPGIGVRFDIGFIGPGNTEISLDKVSRFEREQEYRGTAYSMSTIIIVDRIGERSRIVDMAQQIEGSIVQMSMTHWVKEVCSILSSNKSMQFSHPIMRMEDREVTHYIKTRMQDVVLKDFT